MIKKIIKWCIPHGIFTILQKSKNTVPLVTISKKARSFTPFNYQKKEISRAISKNDKMLSNTWQTSLDHYFFVSESAMECIFHALNMAGKTNVNSILDFPSGHGRVLRSLVSYFPEAEITVCDLEKDAVDFCVKTFSVNGVYSNEDISKIYLGRKYDLIWCGSLLTHFQEDISRNFFEFFLDHLEEDGLLVVSFHGRFAITQEENNPYYKELLKQYKTNDYAFVSDVYHIDGNYVIPNYGRAFVKIPWISSLIQTNEDIRLIYYSERRFANRHDILAIQKKNIRL